MRGRRISTFIVLFPCLLGLASAQETGPSARLGFGGYALPGRWNPLAVSSASADAVRVDRLDREGRLFASETFSLNPSSSAQLPLFLDPSIMSLSLSFSSGAAARGRISLDTRGKVFPGHIVLCLGQTAAIQTAIASSLLPAEPLQPVGIGVPELPSSPLCWDAVSALVMDDPGQSLSPAQREGLLAWIAGGGRLVLTHPRPGEASLLPEDADAGLGRILRLGERDRGRLSSSEFWKAALALDPYAQTRRVRPSDVFPASSPSDPSGGEVPLPPFFAVLAFLVFLCALAAILFLPPLNRRRATWFLAFAALSSLLAFPLGKAMARSGGRGARTALRALILPEGSGTLADFRLSLTPLGEKGSGWFNGSSLRTDFAFDATEAGEFSNEGSGSWNHRGFRPRLCLRSMERRGSALEALLPDLILEGSDAGKARLSFSAPASPSEAPSAPDFAPEGDLAWVSPAGLWWQWLPAKSLWSRSSIPDFAAREEAWIASLRQLAPEAGILCGDGPIDGFAIRHIGRLLPRDAAHPTFWALLETAKGGPR